jgi:SAM-dependent methyltransferase
VTLSGPSAAAAFSASADAYAATVAPSLRPVAAEVLRRADLRGGQRILDVGTGTGIAAEAAVAAGCEVTGLDAAPGMLALARLAVPSATFVDGDMHELPFADSTFDVVIAVHVLLFSHDPVVALREWRRVTRSSGRLSVSVPGPAERTPHAIYGSIYARYGLESLRATNYPNEETVGGWLESAGWHDVSTASDPAVTIRLSDTEAFAVWLRTGSRGDATRGWSERRRAAFRRELLAETPRDADGSLMIPFGALFATGFSS